VKCQWCREEFEPKEKAREQNFCSRSCWGKDNYQKRKADPRPKRTVGQEVICVGCDNTFTLRYPMERYCHPCRDKNARKVVYEQKKKRDASGRIPLKYCWAAFARAIIQDEGPDEAIGRLLKDVCRREIPAEVGRAHE
jgi:hypothetical protein